MRGCQRAQPGDRRIAPRPRISARRHDERMRQRQMHVSGAAAVCQRRVLQLLRPAEPNKPNPRRALHRIRPCCAAEPRLLAECVPACPALPLGSWMSGNEVRASLLWRRVADNLLAWTSTDPSCR
jgi:hypothetical protein